MPGRVLYLLICTAVIFTMKGCNLNPAAQMSADDMQICDGLASQWISTEPGPAVPSSGAKPYMVIPAKAEITSPVYASILPFGPVVIQIKQPPADPEVSYRMLTVIAKTIAINGTYQKWLVGDPITVVRLLPTNLEVTWMPPDSGKYLIMVFFSNVETIPALLDNVESMGEELQHMHWGDHYETYKIHNGPSSLAYTCVQIDPANAVVGAKTLQPVTMMPLGNVTLPSTMTRTLTPWPTITRTPTFTPTKTATATFTRVPPTRKPPTPVPPTPIPPADTPTEVVVNCSAFGDETSCNTSRMCTWVIAPTGGGSCVNR